jgi:hypothetical protein
MTEVKTREYIKTLELNIDIKNIVSRLDEVTRDIDYKSAITSQVEHLKKHAKR